MKTSSKYNLYLLLLPVVIIGIGSGLLDYFTPPMGDDLAKWNDLGLDSYTSPDRSTLSFLAAQYFDCNGRILDGLGPAVINLLPRAVASTLMGLMAGAYFALLAGAAGLWHRNRVAAADALILVALMTLPWWDYMLLRVCQFNYLWGTVFALATVMLFFRQPQRSGWWSLAGLFVISALAGASHEQIGVSLSAVILPLFFYRLLSKDVTRRQTAVAVGLAFGTLFSIASPALWQRNGVMVRDASVGELLITTLPFTLLLLAVCVAMLLTWKGRAGLASIFRSPCGAYILIAFISGLIAIYSTTPGRTGWLSESMAMVALARLFFDFRYRLSAIWTSVLCVSALALLAAHFVVAIKWQYKLGEEYREAVSLYRASGDGTVFLDATPDDAVPFIALGRVRGVPDADDTYLLQVIGNVYGAGKPLVIVPVAFRAEIDTFTDSLTGGGYSLYRSLPATHSLINPSGHVIAVSADRRVITPVTAPGGRTVYLASPLIIDPGDHWRSND